MDSKSKSRALVGGLFAVFVIVGGLSAIRLAARIADPEAWAKEHPYRNDREYVTEVIMPLEDQEIVSVDLNRDFWMYITPWNLGKWQVGYIHTNNGDVNGKSISTKVQESYDGEWHVKVDPEAAFVNDMITVYVPPEVFR